LAVASKFLSDEVLPIRFEAFKFSLFAASNSSAHLRFDSAKLLMRAGEKVTPETTAFELEIGAVPEEPETTPGTITESLSLAPLA
jgi:hypothetical protein